MSIVTDVAAFDADADVNITTVTDPLTITPDQVGSLFKALSAIVETYYGVTFSILDGTGVPSDLIGADADLYFRNNNPIAVYQKISGVWVLGATLDLGILFPDGPLIGLLTAISGSVVTVTPGGWTIDNVIYRKATQTQFTLTAADANYGRYDLIYGTDADTILKLDGTASITPAIPATPVGGTMIDIIFVPSVASGLSPYLLYGSNGGNAAGKVVINRTQADLVATGTGDWYMEIVDQAGNDLAANVMPYSIKSVQGAHTYTVPCNYEDDYSWAHPRIYGFTDKATTQVITILAQ